MELLIGLGFIVFALVYKFLTNKKENSNEFLSNQAERYFNGNNEMNKEWHPNGRAFTRGISLVKTSGNKLKFIKQSKICDTAILH
jgi:hypothetical protein